MTQLRAMSLILPLLLLFVAPISVAADSAAVSQYIQQLSDSDWQVRRKAASELGALMNDEKTTIAALTTALRDDDSRVRRTAADALGHAAAADCAADAGDRRPLRGAAWWPPTALSERGLAMGRYGHYRRAA